MKILDRFTKLFDREHKTTSPDTRGLGKAVARKTEQEEFSDYFKPVLARSGISTPYSKISEEIIKGLSADKARDLVKNSNPVVAKALADFADAVSSGYTWVADRTQPENTDLPSHRILNDFLVRMEANGEGLENKIEQWARDAFTHGGFFAELVIDKDGKTPLDIKTLSATTAAFRRQIDPVLGEYYELGQDRGFGISKDVPSNGNDIGSLNFVSLQNEPTVQYRAIQGEPNNPYGTPILSPAVYPVIITAGFMNSLSSGLKQWVSPNLLLTIDREKFAESSVNKGNAANIKVEFDALVAKIQDQINKLGPGGFLIHGDELDVKGTFSATGRSPLGSITDLRNIINRDLIVGVQSQPLLMGSNETVGETHAIEQLKAYASLITRSQKPLNDLLTYYFNLILALNNLPRLALLKLNYENTAEIKDQALTLQNFHQAFLTASQGRSAFILSLDEAVASGYMTVEQAQQAFDERLDMERQLNSIVRNA